MPPLMEDDLPNRPRWKGRIGEACIVVALLGIVVVMLLPAVQNDRSPSGRSMCRNNLKQLGLAFHNYHDVYGSFPPAYTVNERGEKLHSWQTLLLPFLDQQALYKQIDLTKPWNDPVNAAALATSVSVLACPSAIPSNSKKSNLTSYMVVMGEGLMFDSSHARRFSEVTDGLSETLLVIDVPASLAAPWMEPRDIDEAIFQSWNPDSKLSHTGGFNVLFGDGAVRFLSAELPAETRHRLLTIAGGTPVGDY